MKKKIVYVTDKETNLTKRVIKHGGKRKGAGRPVGSGLKEPTKVIRVPLSKLEEIKKAIGKA